MLIDTHAHLYMPEFEVDIDEVIQNAKANKISHIIIPNVDSESIAPLLNITEKYQGYCLPTLGLHPTHAKEDFNTQLCMIEKHLSHQNIVAIGEIGIDLYWDKSHIKEQVQAFRIQIEWGIKMNLPLIIHARESLPEIFTILSDYKGKVSGVFHCFSGDMNDAQKAIELGFLLGIGGVVTYKKSTLPEVVSQVEMKHLVLETDAPFLAPTPHRGKRNDSSYIRYIAEAIAKIKNLPLETVSAITTKNALELFNIQQ